MISAMRGLGCRALEGNRHHRITREELSVRAPHERYLFRQLRGKNLSSSDELFNPGAGMAELVVTFLALLELVRENQVEVTQPRFRNHLCQIQSVSLPG